MPSYRDDDSSDVEYDVIEYLIDNDPIELGRICRVLLTHLDRCADPTKRASSAELYARKAREEVAESLR